MGVSAGLAPFSLVPLRALPNVMRRQHAILADLILPHDLPLIPHIGLVEECAVRCDVVMVPAILRTPSACSLCNTGPLSVVRQRRFYW